MQEIAMYQNLLYMSLTNSLSLNCVRGVESVCVEFCFTNHVRVTSLISVHSSNDYLSAFLVSSVSHDVNINR